MATASTWLIVAGFVLLIAGIVLRTVLMMRSSDATPPEQRVLHGRELLAQYRQLFPHSPAPRIARALLISGIVVLLAGLAIRLAQ